MTTFTIKTSAMWSGGIFYKLYKIMSNEGEKFTWESRNECAFIARGYDIGPMDKT